MLRLTLYLLLSLALHAGFGWLLRESPQVAGGTHRNAAASVIRISLAPLESPAVSANTPSASPAPVAPVVAKPSKAVEPPRRVEAKPPIARIEPRARSSEVRARPAEPLAPAAGTDRPAASPVAPRQVASLPAAPAVPAAVEVVSREPAFLQPPTPPRYPTQARRRNQQGVVWVEVRLDEFGQQRELKLLRSSGVESLDVAALEAVSVWRFRPETQEGRQVPSRVQIPIQFALKANP
ncbi:energy transducer TonB [Pseudomonas sp. RIT-PI-AD]|uniref:energy transducer TonB n=1 Tax=Pseudomonas sp. RIT-PI-AD TaxID=3035294 RepID=UPI0021DAB03F|nr:energy transducer TonB [Pseudomonas sp. RIT-PI-AD]